MTDTTTPQNTHSNGLGLARLALRQVLIDTYHENVAYMHRECEVYRAEGFKALSKIEIRTNGHNILATLNVVDDESIVACGELGLSRAALLQLDAEEGQAAAVAQAEPPASIGALHRKLDGERMRAEDFQAIVHDIAEHRYSKIELTAFVVACNRDELDREEVFFLTQAMIDVGRHLNWHETLVVDKHCIGGIPGNRTSMLIVPIVERTACCAPRPRHGPSPRPQARPTPWRCWPMWSCPWSICRTLCAPTAAAWPGAAPPTSRRPTTC